MTMVKKNDGYAMVIVLVIITILLLLSAGLNMLISGKIDLSASNYDRIKAKYNAETGIEEGIYNINTKVDPTGNYTLKNINEGNYKFNITNDGTTADYKVESFGYYPKNENEKVIIAYVDEGDYEKSFIYGNQFYIVNSEIKSVNTNDYFSNTIDYLKYDPTNLYQEFIIQYYLDGDTDKYNNNKLSDNTIDYSIATNNPPIIKKSEDPEYYVKKESITDKYGNSHTFYTGQIYHYQSNLTLEGHSQTEELSSEDEDNDVDEIVTDDPTLVVVDGDLNITDLQNIQGFIFIVNGDINYNVSKAAKPIVNNTFFYTGNNFYYNKDVGNLTGEPFLDFDGQIIAENDINLKIKSNSSNSAHYQKVDWPENFDYSNFKKLYTVKAQLVSWDE